MYFGNVKTKLMPMGTRVFVLKQTGILFCKTSQRVLEDYITTSLKVAKPICSKVYSSGIHIFSTYTPCYFAYSLVLMSVRTRYKTLVANLVALPQPMKHFCLLSVAYIRRTKK
jgi:hypothetical protein